MGKTRDGQPLKGPYTTGRARVNCGVKGGGVRLSLLNEPNPWLEPRRLGTRSHAWWVSTIAASTGFEGPSGLGDMPQEAVPGVLSVVPFYRAVSSNEAHGIREGIR